MQNGKFISIMLSLFCLSAGTASAQYYWNYPESAGPYFRAGIGPTFYQTGTLRGYSGASPFVSGAPNQPISYDTGFSANAALGYAFDRYFGIDFGSGYLWGRINNIPNYNVNGSTIGQIPLLADATLSLPIPHTNVIPYLGGGAGGAVSFLDAHGFNAQTTPPEHDCRLWRGSGHRFCLPGIRRRALHAHPEFFSGRRLPIFCHGQPNLQLPRPGAGFEHRLQRSPYAYGLVHASGELLTKLPELFQ